MPLAEIVVGTGATGVTELGDVLVDFVLGVVLALAPVFALLIVGAVIGVMIQGQTVVAVERIIPKLSKISPLAGLKRQFSANTLVEFVKSLIKVLVVGALALWFTDRAVRAVWTGRGFLPENLPGYMQDQALDLLVAVAVFMVPVAIADILWKRHEWRKKLMMTHKELRDELKDMEGSPEIKQRRAQLRRTRYRQRIAAAVPTASVVLTNPTHYAVALKYEMGSDFAPVCVAKGADEVARRIRELAYDNEIPVIENKPLARLLFDAVEVDAAVPVEHWKVVAEIISFVMDLRANRRRLPPEGSALRARDAG